MTKADFSWETLRVSLIIFSWNVWWVRVCLRTCAGMPMCVIGCGHNTKWISPPPTPCGGWWDDRNMTGTRVSLCCLHLQKRLNLILCHSLQTQVSGGSEGFSSRVSCRELKECRSVSAQRFLQRMACGGKPECVVKKMGREILNWK